MATPELHPNLAPKPIALKPVVLAGVSCLSFMGAAAQAQERAPDTGSLVPEIIVTAQKREENANTVPMSITAVTGEQLVHGCQRGP